MAYVVVIGMLGVAGGIVIEVVTIFKKINN